MREIKIIKNSKSFKHLDRTLKALINKNKAKLAGNIFEYLAKLYFEVSPEYKTKLSKIYLLKEVPPQLKKKLRLPNNDEGIDLIAETYDKNYWAIQCKYRSNNSETLKVKGDLATFNNLAFTVCKNISHGIVCSTVNRPPKKTKLLNVGYVLLSEWLSLDRENGNLFNQIKAQAVGKIIKPKKLSPRPHQKEAILKSISYFKNNERGKMIMPCGTGKSLTAFWIAQKIKPKSILIAVPSLALLQQTLKVWTREFLLNDVTPDWLCVCSDDTVKDEQDDFVTFSSDLGIKVDTNPRVIRDFLKKKTKKLKIVFTTYQSGKATSIGSKGFNYDFGIMDEAHKTVGSKSKHMAYLLHQKNIKINKRLFMTATERLFRGNSDEYLSMDDPRDYGKLIYELSFKEAINSKPPIISDYKIITFAVTAPEIEKITQDNKFLSIKKDLRNITARELASALALRKSIKQLNIKNAVSFHRSIQRADNFRKQQNLINKFYRSYGNLKTFHVRGDMPTSDRALEMLSFEQEQGLMTNARCLTEGVDLPAIDCVCFTDPKKSKVDIVQAAGRALRLSKGKKFGYILIPIFIPKGLSATDSAEQQGFGEISNVVRAIATSDKRIVEYLKVISKGITPSGGSPIDGITNINKLISIKAEDFDRAIKIKIWESVAQLNYLSYEDSREIVSLLKFKSATQFKNWKRKDKINLDIPLSPEKTYKYSGWKSWPHFLGKKREAYKIKWAPIEKAKQFIQQFKIKSWTDYIKWIQENKDKLPNDVPVNPSVAYKDNGWNGLSDYLGNSNVSTINMQYVSFDEAKEYLREKKIKTVKEYEKLYDEGKIKKNMPKFLHQHYSNNPKWKGSIDLLGQFDIRNLTRKKKYYSFEKAKKYIRDNKIKSFQELKEQMIKKKLNHFPLTSGKAIEVYGKKWPGTKLFFGLPRFSKRKKFIEFSKAVKILKKYKIKNVPGYKPIRKKLLKSKILLPSKPHEIYLKNWKSWGHYLSNNNIKK